PCTNGLTCLHELVEQVQPEWEECHVGSFIQVDGGALRIEDTDARDEFIYIATCPFAYSRYISNLVLDVHGWLRRCCAGQHYVAQNIFAPARTAGLLEDADVARFARAIVAVDDGEAGSELQGLIFRKRVDALVMEYRLQGYGGCRSVTTWHMLLRQRFCVRLFDQTVIAFADFC